MDLRDHLENLVHWVAKVLWDLKERMVDLVYLDLQVLLEIEVHLEIFLKSLDLLVILDKRVLLEILVFLAKMERREKLVQLEIKVHKVCLAEMVWMG